MSMLAKILVVLNFVLAAVFLGSAAALVGHADNWKVRHDKAVDDYTLQLAGKDKEITKLKTENTALATEKNAAQSERNELRTKADVLQTSNDSLKKAYDELNASAANLTKTLLVAQTTIQKGDDLVKALQDERSKLIGNLDQTTKEKMEAVKAQNVLAENLQRVEATLQDTVAKLSTSEESLQRANFRLTSILNANPGIDAGAEQPAHKGKVLASDNANNIVVISLGAEDGVKAGFKYTISRGPNFVAQIQITDVQAKMASGSVLKGLSKGPVTVGDDAMTAR